MSNNLPASPNRNLTDMYSLDVLDLIRRKFWFITFFVVLSIALALVYFFKAPKTYESWSKLTVEEQSTPTLSATEGDRFSTEKPVERYLEYIPSEKILNPAIDAGGFDDMVTFEESENILHDLKENLICRASDTKAESGAIFLAFQNGEKEETQLILQAIVDSFEDYIQSNAKLLGDGNFSIVEEVEGESLDRLKEIEEEIRVLSAKPELLMLEGGTVQSTLAMKQARLSEELFTLSRERTRLEARLEDIKLQRFNGADQDSMIIKLLQEMNEQSLGGYVTTHQKYVQLKIDELELLNELGAAHPRMIAIRKQIQMVERLRMEELAALRGGQPGSGLGSTNPNGSSKSLVDIYIEELNGRIRMLMSEENSIANEIRKQQDEASAIANDVEKLMGLKREQERLEQYYYAMIDRIKEINVLKDHEWRKIEILDEPSIAEQVSPSLPFSLGGGLVLGCLLGLMFAALKEMAEKTFRSSDDITEALGSRVIGHVGQFGRLPSTRKSAHPEILPEVVALHQPSSQFSEAYRGIRTSIFFRAQETGAKVIQISSPTPGDGKSTTATNLAASIAQSGRKVVIIDADLRKPVQHKMLGKSLDIGLTSLLCGDARIDQAMQEIVKDSLYVITAGPIPGNPAELLTSGNFGQIVEDLKSYFDYIIIDTPPLLAVTDPAIVASHADLIYLVMKIRKGVRTNATRAKEILDSVGTSLGGIVINGLRRKDQKTYEYGGRHGYGNYQYGSYGQSATHKPMEIAALSRNGNGNGNGQARNGSNGAPNANGKSQPTRR